ncbi:MAG: glycoside hydrolase family 3 C-terminal domain-containing protein, partial [Opitutaceae bacterium]
GEEMRSVYDGFNHGDRTRIELPAPQKRLLEAVQATGRPVVFVLMSGSAVAIPWAEAHVAAIVEAWYPGEAGGTAVADVLLGKTNPSGRLPVTFYRSTSDLPAFADYRMEGRTYRYFRGPVLYPFGYGLSYTRYRYDHFAVWSAFPAEGTRRRYSRGGAWATRRGDPRGKWAGTEVLAFASVKVTNTGSRAGDEVVQLYACEPDGPMKRDQESLCGFRRVSLAPGETKDVRFAVTRFALRRWDARHGAYVVPSGAWTFRVGASSADIRSSAGLDLN